MDRDGAPGLFTLQMARSSSSAVVGTGGSLHVFAWSVDLSGFWSGVLRGEVVEQQAVHEDVPTADLVEEDALGGEVQERNVLPGSRVITDEQKKGVHSAGDMLAIGSVQTIVVLVPLVWSLVLV